MLGSPNNFWEKSQHKTDEASALKFMLSISASGCAIREFEFLCHISMDYEHNFEYSICRFLEEIFSNQDLELQV